MADTPTTPTVTPDAATTAPNIQDNSAPPLMPVNQSNPQPAPPPAASQPPAQAAQSAPAAAAAPPSAKPSPVVNSVMGSVVTGALSGLAKHLSGVGKAIGTGVGRELNTWARNSPRGQEIIQADFNRKQEQQKAALAQQAEQRAQQEEARQEALFPGKEQEQKLMLNHLTNQNVADGIKNSIDRFNADDQIQENEMKKNQMQADLLKIFREQGYTLNEEHGHAFDNLGKQQAQDLVSGTVFALNNGLTGSKHGIVIGNTAEAQQTPLLKDANDVLDGWTLDPKTGSLLPHTSSFAADGHNTIYDLLMAQYSAQNEWAIKSKQAEGIINSQKGISEVSTAAAEASKATTEAQQAPAAGQAELDLKKAQATEEEQKANLEEQQAKQFMSNNDPNVFGDTNLNPADPSKLMTTKEMDANWKSFSEKVLTPLQTSVDKSYEMSRRAYDEYQKSKGHLPTGAQSMLMLSNHLATTFGNVKGARVTRDMIQEHLGARSVSDDALVAVQKLTNGDVLSPAQWSAFMGLISSSREVGYNNAIDNARSNGLAKSVPSFLPKAPANGTPIDPSNMRIYLHAAHGIVDNAKKAAAQNGWGAPNAQ